MRVHVKVCEANVALQRIGQCCLQSVALKAWCPSFEKRMPAQMTHCTPKESQLPKRTHIPAHEQKHLNYVRNACVPAATLQSRLPRSNMKSNWPVASRNCATTRWLRALVLGIVGISSTILLAAVRLRHCVGPSRIRFCLLNGRISRFCDALLGFAVPLSPSPSMRYS